MKNIYLKCVYKRNLGDDLLVKIICDRYPNDRFYLMNYLNGEISPQISNLNTKKISYATFRLFRKIAHLTKSFHIVESHIINKCDFVVSIAGSIFMETKTLETDGRIEWFKNIKKDLYLIGSNIGPIYSKTYVERVKKDVFSKAKDICLRDKKSYELVKDIKKVRYAPDVVFSLDVDNYKDIIEKKKVIISVINIDDKIKQMVNPNKEKYYQMINNFINKFTTEGYEVELFSFCSAEKDDIAIKELLTQNCNYSKVKSFYYDGNVDSALKELASAQVIIGTRFHANVLGMLLNKAVIPIIYNDKTRELLKDLSFEGKYVDLDCIDEFDINEIDEDNLKYRVNIDKFKQDSVNHFKVLDTILNGAGNESK